MLFELPDEIRMLKETVRRFVDEELIPVEMNSLDGLDLKPELRTRLEARARELGLWMIDVPTEYGGMGLGYLAMTVVFEELARTIALPVRGPRIFGPEPKAVLYQLNNEQKERYLFPFLRGEKRTAFAQTEPDAGSDPGRMRTTAVRHGDHYVVNGVKRFISHAAKADFVQVVAATDRAKGSRGGLSMLLVDAGTPGMSVTRAFQKMMGDVTYEITFDNVRVPVENLIGKEGEGMKLAQGWITGGRLLQAARGVGVAQRCIELAAGYAQQRSTFGAPLSDRQGIQFMVADMFMEHQLGQTYLHRAAYQADEGTLPRAGSYLAKIFCCELGFRAADRCMQIHGGSGLCDDLPIAKMWKDSRSFMITEGSTELMRATLAREVFKTYR